MKLTNFSLSIKGKCLLENVNVDFKSKTISHILGKNGTGKTCLAKALVGAMKFDGDIEGVNKKVCVIGSYTNLPSDLKVKDIIDVTKRKFNVTVAQKLIEQLNIQEISFDNKMKNLSDGQKQKIKLLFFLATQPEIVVLDEFTNALDKKSCFDIYSFLNEYIKTSNTTIINITHNLTDIEYLEGAYYLIENKNILSNMTKEKVVNAYIKG